MPPRFDRIAPLLVACVLTCSPAAATPSAPAPDAPTPSPTGAPRDVTPSERFAWPVNPHRVARPFDPPLHPWEPGHRGVDLATSTGSSVHAPGPGTVTFSGVVAGRGVVTIRHPQGFDTTYEPLENRIPAGTSVTRGAMIGTLADGGHCPSCLHWGYRVAKDVYRDPLSLIGGRRPVLLPPLP